MRKYSESVGRSYVASAVARSATLKYFLFKTLKYFARSMSMARPSGFASAGIGVGSGARGEEDQLIA